VAAHVRTECAGCGGSLKTVLDLGSSPLADRFPLTPEEDGPAYPLRMAACTDCGLAQLLDVVDDDELFGSGYGFHTSGSPALISYYGDWARWAMRNFSPKFVVDIGCNDGTLLQNFRAAGCKVLGVDPAEPAAVAAATDIHVMREPFGNVTVGRIEQDHGLADLVTGINVAAHVTDPVAFLRNIRNLLASDGHAVLEFQDIEYLVAGCQFDHVYHEHRFFFGARTFAELATKAGLSIAGMIPTAGQGGSLRVILEHPKVGHWNYQAFMGLGRISQLSALQDRVEFVRRELLRELEQARDRGSVAGYGATAKSATLLNFCDIGPGTLAYIEDATREKWGHLTPGTHIPIRAPGERWPATYLLLAWNYLSPVLRRERRFLSEGGRFIVPVPVPMTI
jgi:SAM-dependent methyltransferase